MVIISRQWRRTGLALILTGVLLSLLLANQVLFAQSPMMEARHVRIIKTTKLGLRQPGGLTFAPDRNEFFVLAAAVRGKTTTFAIIDNLDDLIVTQEVEGAFDQGNVTYDQVSKRLLVIDPATKQLLAIKWQGVNAPDFSTARRYELPVLAVTRLRGTAIDGSGQTVYLLDAESNEVIALTAPSVDVLTPTSSNLSIKRRISLATPTAVLRGLAIHPETGHLFTLDVQNSLLLEFTNAGAFIKSYTLDESKLSNPTSIVFAPSADATDDPSEMSLFIANAGATSVSTETAVAPQRPFSLFLPLVTANKSVGSTSAQDSVGYLAEITLEPRLEVVHAASVNAGELVRIIDTSVFSSPDPSDIAYIAPSPFVSNTDRFIIVDGEVEEMSLYRGANMFEINLAGQLVATYTTHPAFSSEPVGAAFNALNGHLFISDDDKRLIHEIDPGPDKLFITADDVRATTLVTNFGGRDAEGVAFGMVENITPTLFMADGLNSEVFIIMPGPDGRFGGAIPDDVVTHFDSEALGIVDPEGIEFNPATGHLYLVGDPINRVAELTLDGTVVSFIDISAALPIKPAGLTLGPNSTNPSLKSLYINDRAVDNSKNKKENDGKVYEFALPVIGNQPPVVTVSNHMTIALPIAATLIGTVIDDGLPNPPALVITTWSKVSGPGAVTFSDVHALQTTASFTIPGVYVLRLTASDSEYMTAKNVTVTVQPANQPPVVNAGVNKSVVLPATAALSGSVTDDGLPNPPGLVTTTWSKAKGPGAVTFANATALQTTASFSTAGVYVLRLTASDSQYTASHEVTITAIANQAPTVNAGSDQVANLLAGATLKGTVSDDGYPNPPASVTLAWSKVSGPGVVTIANANAANTTASFSAVGSYTLRLTASDGALTASDDINIIVSRDNQAPLVTIGDAQTVVANQNLIVTATVGDDGLPNPPATLSLLWEKVSGPGTVNFSDPHQASTTVSFGTAGIYTLRLTASDSALSTQRELLVTVTPANNAPTVTAGSNQSIASGATLTLAGSVSDDGLPTSPGQVMVTWEQISGPVAALLTNPHLAQTTATFPVAGVYVLRLTATDGELTSSAEVTITVTGSNQPPKVNLVESKVVTLSQLNDAFFITATIEDESKLSDLTITWSVVSGSGEMTFANPHAATTTVSVSKEGGYVLQLVVSDGEYTVTKTLTVTVTVDIGNTSTEFRIFIPLVQR